MSATKHETAAGGLYQVPPEPSRWPAIGMAVGVHALLLAFLVIGVSWQNNEPVSVEAEVWDLKTQEAAPLPPPPPPPQPEPEPQPETPPPQAAPKVAPPPPVEQPAPPRQPDIALEREKKRKEELKKQKLEQERQERERELAEQKAEEKKAEEKKAKALADRQARAEAEQEARKEADKKAEELAKKEAADKKKKAEKEKADKLAKEKAQKAEDARLAKVRAEDLKRIQLAASDSGSGGSGTAEKSSAPRRDSGYESAIRAKVKGNTAYAGDLNEPGNPTVTFHVDQLPTGEIMSVRKTRSSGIAAFDDAVERAIKASSPLPKKKDGTVERSLEINFKMKDMQ
jgi:colicin import membrane protein